MDGLATGVALHTVSESMVNQSGTAVNGSFHVAFVPEGNYRREAFGVDTVSTEFPAVQAPTTGIPAEQKVVKTYGQAHQPLIAQNDISGLVVTVPEPGKPPTLQ